MNPLNLYRNSTFIRNYNKKKYKMNRDQKLNR